MNNPEFVVKFHNFRQLFPRKVREVSNHPWFLLICELFPIIMEECCQLTTRFAKFEPQTVRLIWISKGLLVSKKERMSGTEEFQVWGPSIEDRIASFCNTGQARVVVRCTMQWDAMPCRAMVLFGAVWSCTPDSWCTQIQKYIHEIL